MTAWKTSRKDFPFPEVFPLFSPDMVNTTRGKCIAAVDFFGEMD